YLFRVTRSGNLAFDGDEAEDLVGAVEENVAKRPFQPVVRIEVEPSMPQAIRSRVLSELRSEAANRLSHLDEEDVYETRGFIDLRALERIAGLPIRDLRFPRRRR